MLTAILSFLCMVGYTRLFLSSTEGRCACVEADLSASPAARATRKEALALALASISSARPEEHQSPEKKAAPSEAPPASGPPFDEPRMSKEEVVARQKADAHTLDSQILSEEADPIWATKVERATAEAIARIGGSVHLDEVTCRETLCRAKVTHLDPSSHEADVDRLLTMPVMVAQALAFAPSNDDRNTVLYFSRKGTSLSVLQPPMQAPPPGLMEPTELIPP